MDIKNVRNILPFSVTAKPDVKSRSKTDAASDRDGNGQASGEGEKRRRHLSPEEIDEAVKHIEDLPGVKENGLIVRLEQRDDTVVVYVEDRDGKIVRRIPEADLSLLSTAKEKKSGHLLNKAG
jgi:uncharacterized FlaG/YvyC family protein